MDAHNDQPESAVAEPAARPVSLSPDPLAPLRARYAGWLQLDVDEVVEDREEDPDQIRAMQLILRMERDRTPSWHAALRLAAAGAARICLDPRVGTDPGWNQAVGDYATGHIRKVTRRARGAAWQATADLPGITLADGDTEVRVMLPGLVAGLDKRIAKLQVGGTDAPVDEPPDHESDTDELLVWLPPEPVMTLGKAMAQAGHAGMIAAALMAASEPAALQRWWDAGCPVDARRADPDQWQRLAVAVTDPRAAWQQDRLLAVRDAGFTEIAPGTVTVIARAPRRRPTLSRRRRPPSSPARTSPPRKTRCGGTSPPDLLGPIRARTGPRPSHPSQEVSHASSSVVHPLSPAACREGPDVAVPILNLGILAHVDAGKTSLTERLLHAAGVIDHIGRVDDGDTRTDTLALERRRGITIRSAVTSFPIGDLEVNLIDTPGHPDFIAEVERVLDVLDGVVLVISAVEGVQAQTRILMRELRRLGVPVLLFVNKIDRVGARSDALVAEISARLGVTVLPLGSVTGLGTRSAEYRPDRPGDRTVAEGRLEVLSRIDDRLLADYLAAGLPGADRLQQALVEQTARVRVHPLLFGSALTGAGVAELMAAIRTLLPPAASAHCGPGRAVVFTVRRDPDAAKVCYVRVQQGRLQPRAAVSIHHSGGRPDPGRITGLEVSRRARLAPTDELAAGRIGTVHGLTAARIGDVITVGPPGGDDVPPATPRPGRHFTPPSLAAVVVPVHGRDRGRLRTALDQLSEQDPLINVRVDDLRDELTVSLYGEVQKEVIGATLLEEFGIPVRFVESSTICVERPAGTGSAVEFIHTDDNPFLATVGLRVEPGKRGSGVRFGMETAVHGTMPPAFVTAVEDTVFETSAQALYGWQLVDAVITLTHTGYAPRQSHAHQGFSKAMSSTGADFRGLTPLVLMAALQDAGTEVFEPVHRIRLELPTDVLAATYPLLTTHRVLPDPPDLHGDITVITGLAPAAGIAALERAVPGLSRGEGVLETAFESYRLVTGRPPQRPRTDRNPLDRGEYLLRTTRGRGAVV